MKRLPLILALLLAALPARAGFFFFRASQTVVSTNAESGALGGALSGPVSNATLQASVVGGSNLQSSIVMQGPTVTNDNSSSVYSNDFSSDPLNSTWFGYTNAGSGAGAALIRYETNGASVKFASAGSGGGNNLGFSYSNSVLRYGTWTFKTRITNLVASAGAYSYSAVWVLGGVTQYVGLLSKISPPATESDTNLFCLYTGAFDTIRMNLTDGTSTHTSYVTHVALSGPSIATTGGYFYATTISAAVVNAGTFIGDGSGLNNLPGSSGGGTFVGLTNSGLLLLGTNATVFGQGTTDTNVPRAGSYGAYNVQGLRTNQSTMSTLVRSTIVHGENIVIDSNAISAAVFGERHTVYMPNSFAAGDAHFLDAPTNHATDGSVYAGAGNELRETDYSSIGGWHNIIRAAGVSHIGGGFQNMIIYSTYAAAYAFIGGGRNNSIQSSTQTDNTIAGGHANGIETGSGNTISGGEGNTITDDGNNTGYHTIGGGLLNLVSGNTAGQKYSGIFEGYGNTNQTSFCSLIGGGQRNLITNSDYSVVGGGYINRIQLGWMNLIPGGRDNIIRNSTNGLAWGEASTVSNCSRSVAFGYQANARHDGVFVWSDFQTQPFYSTASNQFIVRAQAGMGWAPTGTVPTHILCAERFVTNVDIRTFVPAYQGERMYDVGSNEEYIAVGLTTNSWRGEATISVP